MTVVRPNSIAGINSITVQTGQALNIHDASGNLIRNITSSSGVSTFSSLHVGAGTTTSTQGISVGTGCSIVSTTANQLELYTNSSQRLNITSAGDFGTGGVTPTTQSGRVFHLHAGSAQQRLHMTNNTTGVTATDGFEIIVEQGANTRIRNFEAGDMAFDTGGANNEVMRITQEGNLNIKAPTGLNQLASFRHINLGNQLIINAESSGPGGYTGFQNNAYLSAAGNWTRIHNDHASSIGMDDGIFYYRNAGAGTGNISWNIPLQIAADGVSTFKANKASGYIAEFHQLHADNPGTVKINSPTNNNLRPAALHLAQADSVKWVVGQVYNSTASQAFHICSGTGQTNSRLVVTTAGNVGVNNLNPTQAKLVAQTASGMSIAAVKDNTGASISLGGVTQPRILMEAGASAADFILYRATGSSYSSAGWYKTLTIQSNGSFRTHKADSNLRPYPVIGGTAIGSSNDEYGQFNYADVMSPSGDIGSWVYLGADYHGAAPWPVKAYKIAQHEPGNNGTRVYQIWHDGDSTHHYGGLWEVSLHSWGGAASNNSFTSASISCINGMRDDISLLVYKSTDGVWIRPSTIWGGLFIRRAGWDGSGRDRGSSYCAVKNGGALASGDVNGMGGSIPGSVDKTLYPIRPSGSLTYYGGRDIEDGNDFYAG